MKASRRSASEVLRTLRMSADERREAKRQRYAEKHSREAERLAARTAAETRRINQWQ